VRPLLFVVTLAACAPIPWRQTFTMWPGRTLRVIDAETGKPVPGADVRLVRYQHPHRREDEVKKVKANEKGEITLAREEKSIRTFPLMMHGVPGFSFEACASATDHAGTVLYIPNNDDAAPLEIKLPLGSRPCGAELDPAPPPDGKLRIEGVEKDGERFVVSLAMAPDRTLRKGDALGALTIDEVLFQSPPGQALRRARVAVRGEGTALHYGDLVTAP
jgi:hypothetical protein